MIKVPTWFAADRPPTASPGAPSSSRSSARLGPARPRGAHAALRDPASSSELMGLQWLPRARIDVLINIDGFNEVALHEIENELAGVAAIYPRNWRMRVSRLDMADLLGERAYLKRQRRELAQELLDSPSAHRTSVWVRADTSTTYMGEKNTAESRRTLMVDIWRESRARAHLCRERDRVLPLPRTSTAALRRGEIPRSSPPPRRHPGSRRRARATNASSTAAAT